MAPSGWAGSGEHASLPGAGGWEGVHECFSSSRCPGALKGLGGRGAEPGCWRRKGHTLFVGELSKH